MRTVDLRIPAGALHLLVGLVLTVTACHLSACSEVKTGAASSSRGGKGQDPGQIAETHLQNPLPLTSTGVNRQACFNASEQQIIWLAAEKDLHRFRLHIMRSDGRNPSPLTRPGFHCQGFDLNPRTGDVICSALADSSQQQGKAEVTAPFSSQILNWLFNPANDLFVLQVPPLGTQTGADTPAAAVPTRWTHHQDYAGEPAVSWDGNRVLYITYSSAGGTLYVGDYDGESLDRVLQWPGYLGGARFSPDGKQIVFHAAQRNGNPGLALYLCKDDGSDVRVLADSGHNDFAPAWHPSQEFIIFSSDCDEGDFELNTIRTDGSRRERVTFSRGLDAFPAFSRSGRQILWTSQRLTRQPWQTNIWRAVWIP